ncbi:hypothetical protein C8J57DRAFT_1644624 [Mycena rebaudengoi]|nr:hypothetical protein C8J57DRAFT_1644624 [Mycena rebaudengoi]
MPPSATFCNLAVLTTFNAELEKSALSLDWVLASGVKTTVSIASGVLSLPCEDTVCAMHVELTVTASLPFDLVLGRDWLHFCRDSLPNSRFILSSGLFDLRPTKPAHSSAADHVHNDCAMDVDGDLKVRTSHAHAFLCVCPGSSPGACASTSTAVHSHVSKPSTPSFNILRDIFTAHHCTHSRISVFYSDLKAIQRALALHTVPHQNMSLVQCRQALIHHLITGACVDHMVDIDSTTKLDRSTCCAVAKDFDLAASMSAVILDIVLTADHKKMSTEHLCHVADALNVTTTGQRNHRFKLKAAIRKHLLTVESATVESRSSASVAGLFNSLEAHRRPTLLSIAALHRIPLAEKATVDQIRIEITKHVLSGMSLIALMFAMNGV